MNKLFLTLTILSSIAFNFLGCKSAPKTEEPKNVEKSTAFVNTTPDINGNLFTVCVFTEITEISVKELGAKPEESVSISIPVETVQYDSKDTQIKFELPKEFNDSILASIPVENLEFHIVGVPKMPSEFILNLYNESSGEPLVCSDGKLCVLGTDYTFDKSTKHLKFIKEVEADKSSYLVSWPTKFENTIGTSSIGNKTEDFTEDYTKLKSEWISTLKF